MAQASFKFTPGFLIESFCRYRRQHRGRWVMVAVRGLAAALLAWLGIWAFWRGEILLGIVFAVLCIVMFFTQYIDFWLMRRSFRKSPFCDEDVRIEFDDRGCHVTSPKQDATLQWSAFTRVVHFKDGFLLFLGPKSFNWIPVWSLARAPDVAELEGLLRAKIAEHRIVEPVAPLTSAPAGGLTDHGGA